MYRFGKHSSYRILCNLDHPEKSLILRAPLAKSAGGALHEKPTFTSEADPDYQRMLAALQAGAARLRQGKRFDMPGFRPTEHYIREMQRFGILSRHLAPGTPIDPYKTDRAYWRSFWYRSELGK